jgi:hypothetical protein
VSQIFISYQHHNYGFVADELVKRLEAEKFTVWWDRHIPAGHNDWREKIDNEIENARVMLVIVTPEAIASQYVMYEWSYALGKNKVVIPLTYQTALVHPRLLTHQALNFTDGRTREWNELIAALHNYLDKAPSAAPVVDMVSKDALLTALADLLAAGSIIQSDLNLFMNQELISPLDIAEVRKRGLRQVSPKAG